MDVYERNLYLMFPQHEKPFFRRGFKRKIETVDIHAHVDVSWIYARIALCCCLKDIDRRPGFGCSAKVRGRIGSGISNERIDKFGAGEILFSRSILARDHVGQLIGSQVA